MIHVLLAVLAVVVACFLLTVLVGAPYVPSRRRDVRRAFEELYSLDDKDLLVDIGSGDGLVLREAARRGARALGYEINPFLVIVSKLLNRRTPGAQVRLANFWQVQVPPETTIVYTFGESRDIERMARWTAKQATYLNRPLYFMSYAFELRHHKPLRASGQFALYKIQPLQRNKPQV